jgi:multidrug efflux pump subunit AcrA (membrane-fusion protein)
LWGLHRRVAGPIINIPVHDNQEVKAGDLLFEIDPADYQTALASAKASVANLEANLRQKRQDLNRETDLFKRNVDSKQQFQNSQNAYAMGAEIVVGDLTRASDVARALEGCRRMYFGMSVFAPYLEATVTAATVARELGDLEVLVNISQMTVSQMSVSEAITGRPATSVRSFVARHTYLFESTREFREGSQIA